MKIKFKQDRPGKSIGQLFNNIMQVQNDTVFRDRLCSLRAS